MRAWQCDVVLPVHSSHQLEGDHYLKGMMFVSGRGSSSTISTRT